MRFAFSNSELSERERILSFEDALDDDENAFDNFINNYPVHMYLCDVIMEVADSMVEICTKDLYEHAWAVSEYIEEAIANGLCDTRRPNLTQIFQAGQYEYYTAALYENLNGLCVNWMLKELEAIDFICEFDEKDDFNESDVMECFLDEIDTLLDNYEADNNNTFDDVYNHLKEILKEAAETIYLEHGYFIAEADDFEEAWEEKCIKDTIKEIIRKNKKGVTR